MYKIKISRGRQRDSPLTTHTHTTLTSKKCTQYTYNYTLVRKFSLLKFLSVSMAMKTEAVKICVMLNMEFVGITVKVYTLQCIYTVRV